MEEKTIKTKADPRRSILLVDDDPISNLIATRTLSKLGIAREVKSAVNGEQALQLIHERFDRGLPFPGIILLDLNMPIMNGFKFIEQLKKLDIANVEKIKIIILTSSEDHKDMERAASLGIKHYLVKPLLEEDIMKALQLT